MTGAPSAISWAPTELAHETHERCLNPACPTILLYAVLVNLASVLRVAERPEGRSPHDEQARSGLIRIYGDRHPFTLAANINYTSDLAHATGSARRSSSATTRSPSADGHSATSHPDTLMAEANLAVDERAAGDGGRADERLRADVLRRYERDADAGASRGAGGSEMDPADRGDRADEV